MITLILALLSVLVFKPTAYCDEKNLFPSFQERDSQSDYLIETKQIKIPSYPDAFNPSIARWHGSLLLSFRVYTSSKSHAPFIGLSWLDEQFDPIGEPHLLHFSDRRGQKIPLNIGEDPRLIVENERLWVSYNFPVGSTCRMAWAELTWDGEHFSFHPLEYWLSFPQEHPSRPEKNWVPFFIDGESSPFFSYALSPHHVLVQTAPHYCDSVAITNKPLNWEWGEIRGGSPALSLGDVHLGFFHSVQFTTNFDVIGGVMRTYFAGAYLFSSKKPFELTHISTQPLPNPLSISKQLEDLNCEGIYPGGFVFDSQFIWLVFGRHDKEMGVAKLDRKKFFSTFKKLNPED